ncbi:MAG: acyltransferase [Legionella sp.]|nr:acyltransferase [Legionella sp.]
MITFFRAGLAFFLLSLISCTAHHTTGQVKAVFPQCKASCDARANQCYKTCRNSCTQCAAYAEQSIAESYLYYQHEQYVKGGIIARELKSYRDPLQCRKTTCNCPADYNVCMQSCGGVVRKRLQVTPVC